ncbi:MAG TPA: flagellar basal body-associated FliL family protein [Parvularculaceae bacterium]|nr:flagellar basal body-associated FliL family protein [Parvularculaceae bacterium]
MLKYLPFAIWALALVGGAAGGVMLKSASSPGGAEAQSDAKDAAQALADAKKDAKAAKATETKSGNAAKSGAKGGKDDGSASAMGVMKFGRQFIVPVINDAGVKSLVIMDLSIEVPPAETDKTYAVEPILRDAVLSALLKLSNDGAFSGKLLEADNLDGIRAALLAAVRGVLGGDAKNVLILGITRQDVS